MKEQNRMFGLVNAEASRLVAVSQHDNTRKICNEVTRSDLKERKMRKDLEKDRNAW